MTPSVSTPRRKKAIMRASSFSLYREGHADMGTVWPARRAGKILPADEEPTWL